MAQLGYGYGSEFHLMRLMGRYRKRFTSLVCKATEASDMQWLDFKVGQQYQLSPNNLILPDKEWKGIDFLEKSSTDNDSILKEWQKFWPQTGNIQNWDAIARSRFGFPEFWLLAEAKAHTGEINSQCGAQSSRSKDKIKKAMQKTQSWLDVQGKTPDDWMKNYYQFANRLATLYFLIEQGIHARLLFIYMCGDKHPEKECPKKREGWTTVLKKQKQALGLQNVDLKSHGVHEIFIDVEKVTIM
ncbi:hypothetical protein AKJ51_02140 [candidate division MSBL1 archaeon SCGC-AAA382A20]|uniref:Uncharacterized protein n=1 Tax=candidate division MSBL1 archaeon SCGC-AAA382A20 TaxID=1698280 RepID=A0A133VKV5_9EURY|nr:hypothetical protein AKJ51_02140 [candidate division MSBL1 archaeon SCGC-AAA382A20]